MRRVWVESHREVVSGDPDGLPEAEPVSAISDPIRELASSRPRQAFTAFGGRMLAMDIVTWAVVSIVAVVVAQLSPVGVALTLVLWCLTVGRLGGYGDQIMEANPLRWWALYSAVGQIVVVVVLLSIIVPGLQAAAYVALLIAAAVTTAVSRALISRWVRRRQAEGFLRARLLLRGSATDTGLLEAALERDNAHSFDLVGVQHTSGGISRTGLSSGGQDPVVMARALRASTVLLVGPQPESPDEMRRLVWRLESAGVVVAMVPVPASLSAPRVLELGSTGVPVLAFEGRDVAPERSMGKAVLEWLLAFIAVAVLSPVIAATALIIKLDSPGPVLFRQVRVGRGGRAFTMLKFRTMRVGAEREKAMLADLNVHDSGTLFKIREDPRVTRVGKWLRRFSLDELPQLFNVLRGEMSMIGPRPPLPSEVENYPLDAHRRFLVRPGLTGLWQVSGRSDLCPVESVRLDTYYVDQWSPMMDLRILVRTAKVVVAGQGAY